MIKDPIVSILDIVMALSESIDLVSESLANHNKKVAYISMSIARELGLSIEIQNDLFIAACLHDVGGLTMREKLDLLTFEGDDRDEKILCHCEKGYRILRDFQPFHNAALMIKKHHFRWDLQDKSTRDDDIALGYQIIFLADRIAVSIGHNQDPILNSDDIIKRVSAHGGTLFSPELVKIIESLSRKECFWIDITSKYLDIALRNMSRLGSWSLNPEELLKIAGIFAHIVDFRSHFTSTHSFGVATTAEALAKMCLMTERECRFMKIAGFLHDLGKLYVPESILEKPGPLDKDEYAVMRRHTYYTFRVLEKMPGIEMINEWASFHHERMRGNGYPFHHQGKDLSLGSRIMAVADVSTALTEDRPYRKGMAPEKVAKIVTDMGESGSLDMGIVEIYLKNFDQLNDLRQRSQKYADHAYSKLLEQQDNKEENIHFFEG